MQTAAQTQSPQDHLSVFLVEDSAVIRERLMTLLAPVAGMQVVGFAERADTAVAQILAQRPDVVLLDLNLASGTGIEVLRVLQEKAPGIDVFVLTNFAYPAYRKRCASLGASGFFDKSSEFEKVRDEIAARALQPH